MSKFFSSPIGRLRLYAFLEGTSLLLLLFIGMPLKYFFYNPILVKTIGPVHGAFFLVFCLFALRTGIDYDWKFKDIFIRIFVATFVPFGTFYLDHTVLRDLHLRETASR